MDPTLVPGTHFESQFQICVYEHAILRIYISFFSNRENTHYADLLIRSFWNLMAHGCLHKQGLVDLTNQEVSLQEGLQWQRTWLEYHW